MLVNNAGIGMRTVNPRFLTEPQPFWSVEPRGFRDVVDTKPSAASSWPGQWCLRCSRQAAAGWSTSR